LPSFPGVAREVPKPAAGDFVARNFRFHSGDVLPELKLDSTTQGKPVTDPAGRCTDAGMILPGQTAGYNNSK
jgi:hypothetical protein